MTLAELLRSGLSMVPSAQRNDPVLAPANPENYDPVSRRSVVPNLAAQGEDARYRQRISPDAGANLTAMGAGAFDMFRLPSAAVGMVDPELRDKIRAIQDNRPGPAAAGAMLMPAGMAGLLTRSAGAAGKAGMTAGIYQLGDFADAVSARRFPTQKDEP